MGEAELAVVAAMIAVNSVFAGYEIALASTSLARFQVLAREKRPGAAAALYMKENMEGSLATVQLGITLVGVVAAATGGAGAGERLAPALATWWGVSAGAAEFIAIGMVVVPLTVVTIIFGELVPKVFALRNKEWVCLTLSPALRWFSFSVWPAVWFFEAAVTRIMSWGERHLEGRLGEGKAESAELQELRAIAALARTSRLIGAREEGIILGAARLASRPVKEIALPAEAICMLQADAPLPESLVAAHLDMHTRFPIAERPGDPQSIVGYVNFKDIVAHMRLSPTGGSLRAVMRPIAALTEGRDLAGCMEALMRARTHIALVRDAGERVVGMITLEDILEELVGDIEDEYDRLPAHVGRTGTAWVAGGGVALQRLGELSGLDLAADPPPGGATTLSEWVEGHLGRPVQGGDEVTRNHVRVVVRKVRRQKVQEAQIGPQHAGGTDPACRGP